SAHNLAKRRCALADSSAFKRKGRSTVTFQYPKAALGRIFDCPSSSLLIKLSQIRLVSSGPRTQFFLPRFLRSGLNHVVASISWTFPLRDSALRLLSTQM